jgi:hypothetical protein
MGDLSPMDLGDHIVEVRLVLTFQNFFSSSLTIWQNKLDCLYLLIDLSFCAKEHTAYPWAFREMIFVAYQQLAACVKAIIHI